MRESVVDGVIISNVGPGLIFAVARRRSRSGEESQQQGRDDEKLEEHFDKC